MMAPSPSAELLLSPRAGRLGLFVVGRAGTSTTKVRAQKPCRALPYILVWVEGFEPPTSRSQAERPTKLAYTQIDDAH